MSTLEQLLKELTVRVSDQNCLRANIETQCATEGAVAWVTIACLTTAYEQNFYQLTLWAAKAGSEVQKLQQEVGESSPGGLSLRYEELHLEGKRLTAARREWVYNLENRRYERHVLRMCFDL